MLRPNPAQRGCLLQGRGCGSPVRPAFRAGRVWRTDRGAGRPGWQRCRLRRCATRSWVFRPFVQPTVSPAAARWCSRWPQSRSQARPNFVAVVSASNVGVGRLLEIMGPGTASGGRGSGEARAVCPRGAVSAGACRRAFLDDVGGGHNEVCMTAEEFAEAVDKLIGPLARAVCPTRRSSWCSKIPWKGWMRDCRPLRTPAGSSWRRTRQPAPRPPGRVLAASTP
jgi:hypothetical protein